MDIHEIRLQNLKEATRMAGSQAKLSRMAEIKSSYLSQIKNKDHPTNMGSSVARKIESALDWPRGYMDRIHGDQKIGGVRYGVSPVSESSVVSMESKDVPLISSVAAGDWTEATEPWPVTDETEHYPCPIKHSEKTFALKVTGESMSPKFENGEIIFCDPKQQAENGDYVVAKLTDENQATFKQLIQDGDKKFLKAINSTWSPRYIEINGNCIIVGKVIARMETF